MSKRKREPEKVLPAAKSSNDALSKVAKTNGHLDVKTPGTTIQIVAGSYERVLHGINANVSGALPTKTTVDFANSFLFNAHASAIRCVALSPLPDAASADNASVFLATGGSDERVNVYSLSASPLIENDKVPAMPTLGNNKISENPRNRELGTLMQHSSNITSLHFPTRSKLLSASEDNTIAISRTKDLTVVSTIKAPRPKVQGQPSGDTAPPGATPAGINDFAIHPSMKLMISVGRAEKTMRLWNLVTGKKASVLNFERDVLAAVKESKYSSGEGRKIRWNSTGTEFAVSFERGVVIFGEDAKPKCAVLPQPLTKVHQIAYIAINEDESVLAISTEDGRIVFYDTNSTFKPTDSPIPSAKCISQIGGKSLNMSTRVKDFKILPLKGNRTDTDKTTPLDMIVVSANSDGIIRLWAITTEAFTTSISASASKSKSLVSKDTIPQVGILLGSHDTGSRITCLDAFVMLPPEEIDAGLSEFEGLTEAEEESSSDSDSE